jgi:hypothetical protein
MFFNRYGRDWFFCFPVFFFGVWRVASSCFALIRIPTSRFRVDLVTFRVCLLNFRFHAQALLLFVRGDALLRDQRDAIRDLLDTFGRGYPSHFRLNVNWLWH